MGLWLNDWILYNSSAIYLSWLAKSCIKKTVIKPTTKTKQLEKKFPTINTWRVLQGWHMLREKFSFTSKLYIFFNF